MNLASWNLGPLLALPLVAAAGFTPDNPAPALRLGLAGDTYIGGTMNGLLRAEGAQAPCAGISSILEPLDFFVVNLETPLTRGGTRESGKTFTFRMRPEDLAAIQACGADAVNLANNHVMDYGEEGLADSLLNLDAALMGHFGAGMDLSEARKPWLAEKSGIRIAFLGYSRTLPTSFWAGAQKGGCAPAYEDIVAHDVEEAKKTADHVFVSFHWGEERNPEPRPYQQDLAHLCVDKGASLVFGHHPHIAQPVEIYKGRAILYSLGNFAFGSMSANAELGLLAEVALTKDRVERVILHPLDVLTPRSGFKIVPLPLERAQDLMEGLYNPDGPDHHTVWRASTGTLEFFLSPP